MTTSNKNYIKRTVPIFLAVMVMMSLAACSSDDSNDSPNDGDVVYMLPEINNIILTGEQFQMRDNNNQFACRLFRSIIERQDKPGSAIVSPISVTYLLGMLNAGADGETRDQIMDVLGMGNDPAAINAYCKKMLDEAPLVDTNVTLKIANCIYVNSAMGINLHPQYQSDMQQYYSAQVEALDFNQSSSLDHINNWCDIHTDGMIPYILNKDEFYERAIMYLLNAVYFKATWTEKFDPQDTRNMDFTMANGATAKCKMMHRKALASFGQNSLYQSLCLPYGNGNFAMYILLPNEGKTVDSVIKSLTAEEIQHQLDKMKAHEVDILMPRFTTSTETKLEEVLSSMGMPLAFSDFAQFPYMVEGQSLYVSKMKQKARIEVNEEGTKAAAVTIAEMRKTTAEPMQYEKVDFHATRPFVYYIMEMSTRTIFFMGTFQGEQG